MEKGGARQLSAAVEGEEERKRSRWRLYNGWGGEYGQGSQHMSFYPPSLPSRGKWKYSDYRKKVVTPTIGDGTAPLSAQPQAQQPAGAPAAAALPAIPEDLLGVQAYILWEKAGKPDGADFSLDARRQVAHALGEGREG